MNQATHQFNNTLDQIRYGALSDELTEKMTELTRACKETGRVGEITLTLKIKPGQAGQVELLDNVKVKMPEAQRGTTLMFATDDGGLSREDPRQLSLKLAKDVSSRAAAPVEAKVVS